MTRRRNGNRSNGGRVPGPAHDAFNYRERTFEDVEAHLFRANQSDLVRRVYRGDKAPLAEALRADGLHLVADVIERGKYRKRGARSLVDEVAHLIAAEVRWREGLVRHGRRLVRNTRLPRIEQVLANLAAAGELDALHPLRVRNANPKRVDADRKRLRDNIRKILEHMPPGSALSAKKALPAPAGRKRKPTRKPRAST
jgi:hypothetical protein